MIKKSCLLALVLDLLSVACYIYFSKPLLSFFTPDSANFGDGMAVKYFCEGFRTKTVGPCFVQLIFIIIISQKLFYQ